MIKRIGSWMQTASGGPFWPLDPRHDEVRIDDIAHALGNLCRYGGHCRTFYSVAEHSVYVSQLVPQEHALKALLHDAPEAYCQDIVRPLKKSLPDYAEIETRIWQAICNAFALTYDMPKCVHDADVAIFFEEQKQLMPPPPPLDGYTMGLTSPIDASRIRIFGHMPGRASALFLKRFHELLTPAEIAA